MISSVLKVSSRLFSRCRLRYNSSLFADPENKQIFDRKRKRKHRSIAAEKNDSKTFDYLREVVGKRLINRIEDVSRDFPLALDVGSHNGILFNLLDTEAGLQGNGGGIGGIKTLVQIDTSEPMLIRDTTAPDRHKSKGKFIDKTYRIVSDFDGFYPAEPQHVPANDAKSIMINSLAPVDEYSSTGLLPFKDNTFDLILSNLSLHWTNDLKASFKDIFRVLKPDGAFIASIFGGNSNLKELIQSLFLSEIEREGGFSTHVSPVCEPSDIGNLMSIAGFSISTVDVDRIEVEHSSIFDLIDDLRGMGEGGAMIRSRIVVPAQTWLASAATYQVLHPSKDNEGIKSTFEVMYVIGWKPHESQPKPLKRGSAKHSLKDLQDESMPSKL